MQSPEPLRLNIREPPVLERYSLSYDGYILFKESALSLAKQEIATNDLDRMELGLAKTPWNAAIRIVEQRWQNMTHGDADMWNQLAALTYA
jgi:hypothetical protein